MVRCTKRNNFLESVSLMGDDRVSCFGPGVDTTTQNLDVGVSVLGEFDGQTGRTGFLWSGTVEYQFMILTESGKSGIEFGTGYCTLEGELLKLFVAVVSSY